MFDNYSQLRHCDNLYHKLSSVSYGNGELYQCETSDHQVALSRNVKQALLVLLSIINQMTERRLKDNQLTTIKHTSTLINFPTDFAANLNYIKSYPVW